jgi:hypothetical protein
LYAIALVAPATWEPDCADIDASIRCAGDVLTDPPLGVLTLASILSLAGRAVNVYDLNGLIRRLAAEAPGELDRDLLELSAPEIAALPVEVFGFGSICSSYPLSLRIARELKRLRPRARIVFGGPQASATDLATMRAFPFIDAVIRGEADEILVSALDEIAAGVPVKTPGVTWRGPFGPVRNPAAPVVLDLDRIPSPLFDLHDAIGSLHSLPIEIGRGCPFSCTFCSTNDFFRRRFRMRSPQRVIAEMDRLHARYSISDFDLVHDMFTVDLRLVGGFCQAMIVHGRPYTWRCSARTDFAGRDLLLLMRQAGCNQVFFGVETGSERIQKVIDKGLSIPGSAAAVADCAELGLRTTVSLIVGYPEETGEDLAATGAFALDSARFDTASVEVGLLAALAGTPVYHAHRDHLVFDGIYSSQSHQTWKNNQFDHPLIESYPEIFPHFWGLPSMVSRAYTAEFRHFLVYGLKRCRWLMIALGQSPLSITQIFNRWLSWKGSRLFEPGYYGTVEFGEDLCRFSQEFRPELTDVVAMLATLYQAMFLAMHDGDLAMKDRRHIRIAQFTFRPRLAIECLRVKKPLLPACYEPVSVAFQAASDGTVNYLELPPPGENGKQLSDAAARKTIMVGPKS